jgi:hypothetical protein
MRPFLRVLSLLCSLACSSAFAESFTLTAEDWARPRSGEALVRHPALAGAVEAFGRLADGVIVVRHSADEAGQLWGEELRSWLVALGVASTQIKLESRVEVHGVLILNVTARGNL